MKANPQHRLDRKDRLICDLPRLQRNSQAVSAPPTLFFHHRCFTKSKADTRQQRGAIYPGVTSQQNVSLSLRSTMNLERGNGVATLGMMGKHSLMYVCENLDFISSDKPLLFAVVGLEMHGTRLKCHFGIRPKASEIPQRGG